MARLGELLTASRLIEPDKVEQALRAQVVWGGRLGTNLIELGVIEIDGLSRAIGRQHSIPAALGRHFDKADPDLQRSFPAELARQYSVVPLFHVGADRKIALVALDPLRADALVTIADALKCSSTQLVVSVAAEMRVRYHLERVYGIARATRYLRTKGKTATPFPQFEIEIPIEIEDEDSIPSAPVEAITDKPTGRAAVPPPPPNVDDLAALIDAAGESTPFAKSEPGRDRRTYVKTLADAVEAALPGPTVTSSFPAAADSEDDAPIAALGRIAIKRVQVGTAGSTSTTTPTPPLPQPVVEEKEASSFLDATKKIRRGPNRDRVAELVIDTLQKFVPACEAALLLVVRGDVAIGWKHFCRTGTSNGEIAVPLDEPGLVPSAVRNNITSRGRASELNAIDQLLLRSLGCDAHDLAVIPIAIAGQVMCALASATTTDGGLVPVEAIASSAGIAFSRLIRDASR